MKLVAWDTSTPTGVWVAVEVTALAPAINARQTPECGEKEGGAAQAGWDCKVVAEWSFNVTRTHSERLLWGVHQLLEAADWRLAEVDAFGVGVGPGSFTGLRIGVSTARTLAHYLKKPLIGISSLKALIQPVARIFAGQSTLVIAVTDACKGEVFGLWGLAESFLPYQQQQQQRSSAKVLTAVQFQSEMALLLAGGAFKQWMAVGNAVERVPQLWQGPLAQLPQAAAAGSHRWWGLVENDIQGRFLGVLAAESCVQEMRRRQVVESEVGVTGGGMAQDNAHLALGVLPEYLRASDAEVQLQARIKAQRTAAT